MQLIKTKKTIIESKPVIYEVNLTIDNDVIDEFDAWLQKHIDEMLAIPGFISAATLVIENNDDNTKQRSVQFRLTNQAALDSYYEKDAERLRAIGIEKFANKMTAQRRVLTPSQAALAEEAACANCGTQLEGRFCRSCGQREEPRVPTFMAMLKEVTNAMFGLESKLWQSIYFLILKPGHLTVAYLSGHRKKYTTPFRLFLLFSIVTFAYLNFLGKQSLDTISVENLTQLEKGLKEIEKEQSEQGGNIESSSQGFSINLTGGLFSEERENEVEKVFLSSITQALTDLKEGRTDKVVKNFIQPLPKALLLFLPFIAFACKIIYLGRGKYYVEHLIYLLHNHAFLYAIILITLLTFQLSSLYPYLEYPLAILINLVFVFFVAEYFIKKIKSNFPEKKIRLIFQVLILVAISYGIYKFTKSQSIGAAYTLLWVFYVPYYIYRSMRNVYKSSRFVTVLSYSLIGFSYMFLFTIMLVLYIVYSGYSYG